MSVLIGPATESDLDAIVHLERVSDLRFAGVGLQAVLDAPQTQAHDHAPSQQAGRLLTATDETGRLAGFVRIDLVDESVHIEQVSVHPDFRGRRIGAQLMQAAERWAVEHGYGSLTLCTYRDVPWNAPYYARLGWQVLNETELGPQLRRLREHERELGLEVQPRVAMHKSTQVL